MPIDTMRGGSNALAVPLVTEHRPDLILEPLLADAVTFDPRVTTLHDTSRESAHRGVRVPIVTEDAVAGWIAEGEEIAPTDVHLDELVIYVGKVAALIPITNELADDSRPSAGAIVGRSIARALVYQIDKALFTDSPAPPSFGGLPTTAGEAIEITTPLANLDPLLEAKAAVAMNGGQATSILAHPADALTLARLKDSDGSNRALLADLRTVADLPLIQSAHCEQGTLWVVDANATHVALRSDIDVTASDHALFSSDRMAIRGTVRLGWGFAYPQRIARVTITPED